MNTNLEIKLLVLTFAFSYSAAFCSVHSWKTPVATTIRADTDDNLYYINEERRSLMNLILVSSVAVTVGGLAVPYFAFFMPPSATGGSGETTAKDAIGNEIITSQYLEHKQAGDRSLVQGLRGDAT